MNAVIYRAREAALFVLRRLLPRSAKRFLKRFWDPNQAIAADELELLANRTFADTSGAAAELRGSRRPLKHDVICFSIIDWDFRWQRPQQIMSEFANRGHRVFYISTSRFAPPRKKKPYEAVELRPGVWEIQLQTTRFVDVYSGVLEPNVVRALLAEISAVRRDFDISAAVGYVQVATWAPLAQEARDRFGWRIVYDCMDEWNNFPGMKRELLETEDRLVRSADVLVVSAQRLWDKYAPRNPNTVLARNGTNFEHFHAVPPNHLLEDAPRPIVGYFGAIADWFDLELMLRLAKERPSYTFVLLGGVFDVSMAALQALPNVHVLGQKPYDLMPAYLQRFDVCMIPFKVNAITEATDPVKFYEYISQGKPVVAPRMPELYPYREYLYIADDHDDFIRKVDIAVAENDPALRERRIALARENTWTERVARIEEGIRRAHPRASVVVVTYNNLDYNRLCLESLLRNSLWPEFEVIVVDNASADGTPEFLRELESRDQRVKVILNSDNRGFAKANNQGLALATGEYLVLLNNDTVVPNGWLPKLIRHLDDPAIGIANAVTNFSGNESRIEVSYSDLEGLEEFAEKYTRDHEGRLFDIRVAAMYCVAMRREVFEKVGPLDENFGMGLFEDDDYSHRVRLAGLRVVCVEDAFVHHFGQASFKKLSQREYQEIWDRNQKYYEQKWAKAWEPHTLRSGTAE
jgi:GT2 family glycosyltransferase